MEKRREIKFIVKQNELNSVLNVIYKKTNFQTLYDGRTVNSIYFDTSDYDYLNDNLNGLSLRQKIRLRWYDDFLEHKLVTPNLEFKIKSQI